MKILLDSSALVPALVPAHPRHELCYPYLKTATEQHTTAYISTHSLAEVYSIITRLPVKPRPTPIQAQTLALVSKSMILDFSLPRTLVQQAF